MLYTYKIYINLYNISRQQYCCTSFLGLQSDDNNSLGQYINKI